MKLHFAEPDPSGSERARAAKKLRDLATEISRLQPHRTGCVDDSTRRGLHTLFVGTCEQFK